MRSLDTNVLVRYVVADDDAAQSAAACRLIDRDGAATGPLLVTDVVLAEFVWVLRARYRLPKPAIVAALEGLLQNARLAFEACEDVLAALDAYRDAPIDFADALIAARAAAREALPVATFDQAASRLSAFQLLTMD